MSYGVIYFGRFDDVDVRRFRRQSGESPFESTPEEIAEDQMYDLLRMKGRRVEFGKWISSEHMGEMEERLQELLTALLSCGGEGRITLLGDATCPVDLARSYSLSEGKLRHADLSARDHKAALSDELYRYIVEQVTPGEGAGGDAPPIVLWGGKKQSFAERKRIFAALRKGEVPASLPEVDFEPLVAGLLQEYPEAVRKGRSLQLGTLGADPEALAFEVTWTGQSLTARFQDPEDCFPNCLMIAASKSKLTGAPLDVDEAEAMG